MFMKKLLSCCYAFLLMAVVLVGQTSTSEISGTIRDATGAVIPEASVTVTNEATGITYRQSTTAAGLYAFPSLPVGTYSITAEMKGFKTGKQTGNLLVVGTPLDV